MTLPGEGDQAEVARVATHESGHYLEYHLPGAYRAAREFLDYRLKGEKPSKLADKFPDYGYRDDETGRKDEFDKALSEQQAYYAGKKYNGATEIISMGIERFAHNPATFAQQDPEYCKFILGILDGSLRGGGEDESEIELR